MPDFFLPHHHGNDHHLADMKEQLDKTAKFEGVADTFKLLGDASRLKIFWLLCHREECVINIAAMMEMTTPAVSHHLKLLKAGNLVSSRRDGKEVYYKATNSDIAHKLHVSIESIMEIIYPGNSLCPFMDDVEDENQ